MADWTLPMKHSFEYYEVDPASWADKKHLDLFLSCSITRDASQETLGNATFESDKLLLAETYVRVYFTPEQNDLKERYPLGTFMVQTEGQSWNGTRNSYSLQAYTPLLELKDNKPPLGYTVKKGNKIMETVSEIISGNSRLKFVPIETDDTLEQDFVAEGSDTWLSFLIDLAAKAKYSFALDELGCIYFNKQMEVAALQPRWTYNNDNSSIIYPDISFDSDLYGVPNVCEVIYSTESVYKNARVENNDEVSPISTVNRKRTVLLREENPNFGGTPSDDELNTYANTLLENASTLTSEISYSHGFNEVRIYDGIRINHSRSGISDIKAQVISQTLDCGVGLKVDETARFTKKLWEAN